MGSTVVDPIPCTIITSVRDLRGRACGLLAASGARALWLLVLAASGGFGRLLARILDAHLRRFHAVAELHLDAARVDLALHTLG